MQSQAGTAHPGGILGWGPPLQSAPHTSLPVGHFGPGTQMPPQSAPPLFGSHESFGLSMHFIPEGHDRPRNPLHGMTLLLSSTHIPGQSAPPLFGSQPSS